MRIINIHDGNVLSGELDVIVSPDNSYQRDAYYEGEVAIDGSTIQGSGVCPQENGTLAMTFPLSTNHYSNGFHTLLVTDHFGNRETRQVEFRNTLHQVYPGGIFDVHPDAQDIAHEAHITALVSPPQPWRAEITGYETVVRVFSGEGGQIDIVWDGTDDRENMVQDNPYFLTFSTPANSSMCMAIVSKVSME